MSLLNGIVSFYIPQNSERRRELEEALYRNVTCYNFKKLHIFVDSFADLDFINNNYKEELKHDKIHIVSVGTQPRYSDFFKYANTLKNEICMIMNSDIWLHSISDMRIFDDFENTVYGITRHESNMMPEMIDLFNATDTNFVGSQDAFIFKSPVKPEIIQHTDFVQNINGSDNVLLHKFKEFGYNLFNPASQIIIIHEHKSNIRDPSRPQLPPPWIKLFPQTITFNDE